MTMSPTDAALKVGALTLDGRAFLAPMSGVTDLGMRRVARRFGASLVVSEMVACDDYVRGDAEHRLRAEGDGIAPHCVQIAGCDPYWMGEAARLAEACGADLIDINMGCPARRVIGGEAGSALMRDPDLALALIRATARAVKVPVSVKMRLGWDHASINAPDLARRAEAEGVALVTVHGRTRQQFYKGRADWAAVEAVRAAIAIPLVVNGDGESLACARAMLAQSGADAVMIGRAAVGRPWLVGEIARGLAGLPAAPITPQEKGEAAVEHYDSLLSTFGIAQGLRHARKHVAAYAEDAGAAPARRLALVTDTDPDFVRAGLARLWLDVISAKGSQQGARPMDPLSDGFSVAGGDSVAHPKKRAAA